MITNQQCFNTLHFFPFQQPFSALSHLLKSGAVAAAAAAAAAAGGGGGEGGGRLPPPPDQESIQRLAAVLSAASTMKVPPMTLPTGSLPHPFSHDLLWRYPNPFMPQPPPSPMESQLKAHLPGGLGHDPRIWNREDVAMFMRYCEREFDLDKIDMDRFQMNGK